MVFAICAGAAARALQRDDRRSDKPAWAGNFFIGMPAPAGAITVLLPIYLSFPRHAASPRSRPVHLRLYARHRVADGVAAAGVFRQARRQARGAGNGAAGFRRWSVLFFALLISYPWVVLTSARSLSREPAARLDVPIATMSARMPRPRRCDSRGTPAAGGRLPRRATADARIDATSPGSIERDRLGWTEPAAD